MAECCFPSGATYVVRASNHWVLRSDATGARHRVRAAWQAPDAAHPYKEQQLDCSFDPNPRKRMYESRVFEMCTGAQCEQFTDNGVVKTKDQCSYGNAGTGVLAGEPAEHCIYSTATGRFAVYRGDKPSVRDMSFAWQTMGGFSPMRIDFSVLSAQVSPMSLASLPAMDMLTVVDGSSLGLVLLSLDNLTPRSPALN